MREESIEELEQKAEKGSPSACLKLSHRLLSAAPADAHVMQRAESLNKKAFERWQTILVQSLGRHSASDIDRKILSMLHLGILHEIGPVGIKRDPVTGFHLIQEALGEFVEDYHYYSGELLNNLKIYGYGTYPEETERWKKVGSLARSVAALEESLFEKLQEPCSDKKDCEKLKSAASLLEALLKDCEVLFEEEEALPENITSGETDASAAEIRNPDVLSELLYLICRLRFMLFGLRFCDSSRGAEGKEFRCGRFDLAGFLCLGFSKGLRWEGRRLTFDGDSSWGEEAETVCSAYNDILSHLESAAELGNGKAIMELATLWDYLVEAFDKKAPKERADAFQMAESWYLRLAKKGDPTATYNLGALMVSCADNEEIQDALVNNKIKRDLGVEYFKLGADLCSLDGSRAYLNGTRSVTSHMGDVLAGERSIDLTERWKFFEAAEDPGYSVEEDDVFLSASRPQRAEAVFRFKVWKKTALFISRLRENKPLSRRVRTSERFSPMTAVHVWEQGIYHNGLQIPDESDLAFDL
jgi:hypothetical protein